MEVRKILILLGLISLTACGRVSIESISTPLPTISFVPSSTPTILPFPASQSNPTATVIIPSPTMRFAEQIVPTATTAQPVSPTSTAPKPTTATEQNVQIVLIALEDNGQSGTLVGCGDSAIPVTVTVPRSQGVLRAALEKLLSAKQQFYGESGYYNALYQSDLQVSNVTIEQGKAIIHLTGTLMLGGTCDAPRVEAQIKQTALQFSTVSDVAVFVNDKPLEEVLSTK